MLVIRLTCLQEIFVRAGLTSGGLHAGLASVTERNGAQAAAGSASGISEHQPDTFDGQGSCLILVRRGQRLNAAECQPDWLGQAPCAKLLLLQLLACMSAVSWAAAQTYSCCIAYKSILFCAPQRPAAVHYVLPADNELSCVSMATAASRYRCMHVQLVSEICKLARWPPVDIFAVAKLQHSVVAALDAYIDNL